MTIRLYVMPKTQQTVSTRTGVFAPKYFSDIEADVGSRWACTEWTNGYLMVIDGSSPLHTTLAGFADVVDPPVDLTLAIGSERIATQNAVEDLFLPMGWVAPSTTWLEVLRGIGQICQFFQRLQSSTLFDDGRDLQTRWNTLPVGIQNILIDAADSFGWDKSTLSGNTRLRDILRAMGIQYLLTIHIFTEDL